MTTKERILEESLILFSAKGYDGTSVEEIAASVGVKAPSLYKHFKGKEEILTCIIDNADRRYEELFGSTSNIGKLPDSAEEFIQGSLHRIRFTMTDPMIRRVRMLTAQEQFRNKRIADFTTRHQLEGLKIMISAIVEHLIKAGAFRAYDPQLMALVLSSPVSMMLQMVDRHPERQDEAMECIERHLRHMCEVYAA